MKTLLARIAPAFDEILVYPCTLLGVICSPVIAAAMAGQTPERLRIEWWLWIVALFLAVGVLMGFEMVGSAEGKRKPRARAMRYGFAFLLGVVWRQAVPAITSAVVNLFRPQA